MVNLFGLRNLSVRNLLRSSFYFSALLVALLMASGFPRQAQASLIAWGAPQNITNDADVSTNGPVVGAFNLGDTGVPSTTVNGVLFQSFPVPLHSNAASVGNFSVAGGSFNSFNTMFGPNAGSFASLSASYKTLLAAATTQQSFTLTISGLLVGAQYQFQWWTNDSEPVPGGTHSAVATDSVVLSNNTTGQLGGLGQFALGTFTADATTQVIAFGPNSASGFVNAFQLRQVSAVPEAGMNVMLVLSLVGIALWCCRARKSKTAS